MVADLHILRKHALGLPEARKLAFKWAEMAEQEFQMACTYEEGNNHDEVCFKRSGVNGILEVTRDKFELKATLGFLLGAFKDRIEAEIVKNLDTLLAGQPKAAPAPAAKKAIAKKAPPKAPARS
jgi:putative polyhydroxyalkanoate system protein